MYCKGVSLVTVQSWLLRSCPAPVLHFTFLVLTTPTRTIKQLLWSTTRLRLTQHDPATSTCTCPHWHLGWIFLFPRWSNNSLPSEQRAHSEALAQPRVNPMPTSPASSSSFSTTVVPLIHSHCPSICIIIPGNIQPFSN